MKNSEKGKFENAWQNAFENAEQAPSEDVWEGVDKGLNLAETSTMKHRVLFYQRLAAASITIAMLFGSITTYYVVNTGNGQETQSQLSLSDDVVDQQIGEPNSSDVTDQIIVESNRSNSNSQNNTTQPDRTSIAALQASDNNTIPHNTAVLASFNENSASLKSADANYTNDYPSHINRIPEPQPEVVNEMKGVTIVRILPAMPSSFMASNKKNKEQSRESLWASIGASTGSYSPSANASVTNSRSSLNSPGGLASQNTYSTSSSKGTAFSLGMNVGKRLSEKWLIQGGVSYMNQAIGYTSNYAVLDANNKAMASIADYSSSSLNSVIAVSTPYQINSVNEFISLPVQAGYLLLDKKIGWQLNTGISTDFFMQNTLTDKSGQLASSSSGAGESSPFRSVSWAGLMGTELSYRIASQYRISVAPGLRYSLNSVFKSEVSSSNPMVWDVGFRFRYIFK